MRVVFLVHQVFLLQSYLFQRQPFSALSLSPSGNHRDVSCANAHIFESWSVPRWVNWNCPGLTQGSHSLFPCVLVWFCEVIYSFSKQYGIPAMFRSGVESFWFRPSKSVSIFVIATVAKQVYCFVDIWVFEWTCRDFLFVSWYISEVPARVVKLTVSGSSGRKKSLNL